MNDLDLAVAAAEAGAAVVRRYFGERLEPDLKRRNDPVTVADRESERAIIDLIRLERPDDRILAEESGLDEHDRPAAMPASRRWIVDPLDGTVNFVHGIPQVSVSIALYEDDRPLVAVILDVIREEAFTAELGRGAKLNGNPIAVSAATQLADAVVSTGFPYDHHEHASAYTRTVALMLEHVNGVRRLGSAALDLAWVAAGRFEAHWEYSLAPWDIAAGALLVSEAGGVVTNASGDALIPEDHEIIAANAALHAELLQIVRNSRPDHLPPVRQR
jgi:myo-inositol-1(or 4)-monophosphatase